MNMRLYLVWIFSFCFLLPLCASYCPEFSTAVFFRLSGSGREVYSMNPAWRLHKGHIEGGAHAQNFDDSVWEVTSLPDGIELLPVEASGSINYQGEVWYRKCFIPDKALIGKKVFLHFEAIMGKSRVYINGKLKREHYGGYLPIVVDISDDLQWERNNVIAVWADNSNDPLIPPGPPQEVLDFTYFGGIYRDCWLVSHNPVYITDPNYEDEVAGGGLFVAYDNVSDRSADVLMRLHVRNENLESFKGRVEFILQDTGYKTIASSSKSIEVFSESAVTVNDRIVLQSPALWSPDFPVLYNLIVKVKDLSGNMVDGYRQRIGIRSIEFRGVDGFWLNGKPYPQPIIGANRHQDYAVVGNAVANSVHWRDAKKLRDAGMKVIRNAHYPQDPAFMDACDELGLFVIVNTPGWHHWSEDPVFEKRVHADIRNIVRRDRNHASVWMWEPLLNETWFPESFAKNALDIVGEEYPFPYSYCASDKDSKGAELYPVIFSHTINAEKQLALVSYDSTKTYFSREWGDNPDDWSGQNSPSRVSRSWGEVPMLVQAWHYANPPYPCTNYTTLSLVHRQHVGGALWHSFDHQRGGHPDSFYGGIMDAFRQPKTSYYMFKAQRDPKSVHPIAESGPMVYIAHQMTPFSPKDVDVYSNCDEVRLSYNKGGKTYFYKKDKLKNGMPSPIITFKNVYDFMIDKNKSMYEEKQSDIYLLAEGYIDGKLVATHKVIPARKPSRVLLWADNESLDLVADGSDFVTIVAAISDENGVIKRLNDFRIKFEVEGEGRLLGNSSDICNPAIVRWGTAPILLRSTTTPGKVKIKASVLWDGSQMPMYGELEIVTRPSTIALVYDKEVLKLPFQSVGKNLNRIRIMNSYDKEKISKRQKEIEKEQYEFGEKR